MHQSCSDQSEILSFPNLKAFSLNELKTITRNFHPSKLIGEGAFGRVYKGRISNNSLWPGFGIPVAVKKHRPGSFLGRDEWLKEINYLGRLHHPNIVNLIGFCSEDDNLLLVYEFMPERSLNINHRINLSWETRIKIAVGVARGLSFLHEKQIIHCDVKLSHVLLDSEFNAHISGFSLAITGPTNGEAYVETEVRGTHGMVDPVYAMTGHLSTKSDVYSFGVLLLELLSGRRAIDMMKSGMERNLMHLAKTCLGDKGKIAHLMDPELQDRYPYEKAEAVIALALQCTDSTVDSRPCMSLVSQTLEMLL